MKYVCAEYMYLQNGEIATTEAKNKKKTKTKGRRTMHMMNAQIFRWFEKGEIVIWVWMNEIMLENAEKYKHIYLVSNKFSHMCALHISNKCNVIIYFPGASEGDGGGE